MATTNHSNSPSLAFLAICAALLLAITAPPPTAVAAGDHHHNNLATSWIPTTTALKPQCKGSIWECMLEEGDDEFGLDSESNRRILATSQYISYGALRRNTVPCSRRGSSYYNCRPGAQANPYSRGCSAITRCRG